MRLDTLSIDEFRNLRDIEINFDETSPYTVLVGENGSGKSNLIEALAIIFRDLDRNKQPPFAYTLRYRCRGNDIEAVCERGKMPRFRVRRSGESKYRSLSRKQFMADDESGRPLYRPAFVFGYYSGPSDRLASVFEWHEERFYKWIIKSPEQRGGAKIADPNSLRRLFYAQTVHGQFALIAFFMQGVEGAEEDLLFLREQLQIEGLDSVLFALKQPPWNRKGGNERFWHAFGEVSEFLDRVYASSMLPARMPRRIQTALAKRPLVDSLYLFLSGQKALEELFGSYDNQYAFFTALESTHLSKLLAEVRTRVRMTSAAGGSEVTYRDLSEGEQQLLLVLGLLKFTARDEALFLLDEPDTHLNPIWSTQYLGYLERFIGLRDRRDSCHVVMSSHDPLVFAGLTKSEVRIFRRDDEGRVLIEEPDVHPRGMGVAAILTSDLFRLRTTLDPETQADLDEQRLLAMKENKTEADNQQLRVLGERLSKLGFSRTIRDPLYEQFVKAWTEREDPAWRRGVELTPQQQADRARLSREIVEELRRREGIA
jgi:predicted ATPase